METMRGFDAAIVGAGIIGASTALELSGRGMRVALLDRQQPGNEASWAAAGMLSPAPDSPDSMPLFPLAQASLAMYGSYVESIEEFSEIRTGYRRCGAMEIFFGPTVVKARDELVSMHQRLGLATEAISAKEARRMEPAVSVDDFAAAWMPEEAAVSPRELMRAVLIACRHRGVEILAESDATAIRMANNTVMGVQAGSESISARAVVVAAGCFTHLLPGLEKWAPTRPVRGQMVGLKFHEVKPRHVLRSEHGYIVPRENGFAVAGSTLENAGFEKNVTREGIRGILAAAAQLAPAVASAKIVETWAGLRPDTPDHLPILGACEVGGLFFATGHYRNGILLAPITAKNIADWITNGNSAGDLSAFSPLRFVNGDTSRGEALNPGADHRQFSTPRG
jgi:glycine oxidase